VRILTLCYEYPPLGGGGGRVAHGLARTLVSRGHAVDVVTMGFRGLPARATVEGVRVHRVPCIRRSPFHCTAAETLTYLMAARPAALSLCASARYDLCHAHFILPDGWLAWHLARRTGLPYVVTAHGSDVPGYNPHRLKLAHVLAAPVWKRAARDAATIVCPSAGLASLVARGEPRARTVIVPNGIDPRVFDSASPRERTVLFASRLLERKGAQQVIAALDSLDGSWSVVVAGDGPFRARLEALASPFGERVRFVGWLDGASSEYRRLFENAAIFALPSEAENFPVVLLEAMTAGAAVVTTRGTGCEEVVGDAGLLVPVRDPAATAGAIARLAGDPDLRASMGEAARRRVEERFSWDAVADGYLCAFGEALPAGAANG
jgi:glycosyltransferase involved in cell wall biosynthesis